MHLNWFAARTDAEAMALRDRRHFTIALVVIFASMVPLPLPRQAASGTWASALLQFWFVVLGAGLCVVLSVGLLVMARRAGSGEIAILAASLTVLGTLSTVHGLAIPGVLLGSNHAVETAALLALPMAVAAALPLMMPDKVGARRVAARWRGWIDIWVALGVLGGALLLAPEARDLAVSVDAQVVLVGVGIAGAFVLARRQLRLYVIGRRTASLVAAVALVELSVASVTGAIAVPSSPAWWAAQSLDLAAVLAACVSLAMVSRSSGAVGAVLGPIVNRDPLVALELGLTPEIHAFVAALDRKDTITRDHVVRVADLAMRVGTRAGLPPGRLRVLGLGALLHDIGKLVVPSNILGKPSALTDAEWSMMRTHSERGATLLERSPTLCDVAPLVRSHHERPDGGGYPDGLTGDEIPREVGIISVCDAYDAMTNARQYRGGMPRAQAEHILSSGAGAQWRLDAVARLLDELAARGADRPTAFQTTGRERDWEPREIEAFLGVCADAIPPEVRAVDRPEPADAPTSIGRRAST